MPAVSLKILSVLRGPKSGDADHQFKLQSADGGRYHGGCSTVPGQPSTMVLDPRLQRSGVHAAPLGPEDTIELLSRVKRGDEAALEALLARCVPALRRFAHGRLPVSARGMQDTDDLVQDTVVKALKRLATFEAYHDGALHAFLRQAVLNRIRDIIRQRNRRPVQAELPADLADDRTSPLEQAIGSENLAIYEAALARIRPADREAIVSRLELQATYEELAVSLAKPTASAARVAVMRAMKRLMEEMRRER